MFNGNKVIDADGHVMEPNELYDQYLEEKFKPDLEELKREVAASVPRNCSSAYFHQLNTGRPLGVPHPDKPLIRTGRNPRRRATRYARRLRSSYPHQGHGSRGHRHRGPVRDRGVEFLRAQDRRFRDRDDPRVPSMARRLLLRLSEPPQGRRRGSDARAGACRRTDSPRREGTMVVGVYLSGHIEDVARPSRLPSNLAGLPGRPICPHVSTAEPRARPTDAAPSRWATICSCSIRRPIRSR